MKLATSIDIADDVITNKKSNVMLFFVLTLTDFVRRCLFEIIFFVKYFNYPHFAKL